MYNNRNSKALREFGESLKKLRTEKGLTIRGLADYADIAHSQVWVLENGKGDPSLSTLLAIADALEMMLDDLVLRQKKK